MTFVALGVVTAAAIAARVALATFGDGSAAARHSRGRVSRWWKRRG